MPLWTELLYLDNPAVTCAGVTCLLEALEITVLIELHIYSLGKFPLFWLLLLMLLLLSCSYVDRLWIDGFWRAKDV